MEKEDLERQVLASMQTFFGDTADLSEELVDTLSSMQFFMLAPSHVTMEMMAAKRPELKRTYLLPLYMRQQALATGYLSYGREMIDAMREVRGSSVRLFFKLESDCVDRFQYNLNFPLWIPEIVRRLFRYNRRHWTFTGISRRFGVPFRDYNV